jgi:4'-phosphopantetheinyl transferase EntD
MFQTVAPATPGLNPASLTAALAGLFPLGVVGAHLAGAAPVSLLTESELGAISHCAEKRIGDFAAGRLCARRALAEFGVHDYSLLSAPDRQPLWPPGLLGSITHTEGYSAAVVTRRGHVRSLGLDSETIAAVHEELWPRILGASERACLGRLPEAARDTAAALMFAAKEAFYKCQFTLTGEWLEFEDVHIESPDWMEPLGRFSVQPQRSIRLQRQAGNIEGQFRVHAPYVTCGAALCA